MTVTCLTTIFFAEAEAVDEEDTARTNCLVTKAMVQRRRQGQPQPDPEKASPHGTSNHSTSGDEGPGCQQPARPGRSRDVTGGGWGSAAAPPIGLGGFPKSEQGVLVRLEWQ